MQGSYGLAAFDNRCLIVSQSWTECSPRTASELRDLRGVDRLAPGLGLVLEERCELLARTAVNIETEPREALANLRLGHGAVELGVELSDDSGRRCGRREDPVPHRHHEVEALLAEGRHIGKQRVARLRRRG